MSYIVGVQTPEGFREFYVETKKEKNEILNSINKNKWRIKYSASGKFAKGEFLEKQRIKAIYGKEGYEEYLEAKKQRMQYQRLKDIKEGKVTPGEPTEVLTSEEAFSKGLISQKEYEQTKGKDILIEVKPSKTEKKETQNQYKTINTSPITLETTLPKSTSSTTTTIMPKPAVILPEIELTEQKERLKKEIEMDRSLSGFLVGDIATKITPADPFGFKTLWVAGKGLIAGKKREEIAKDVSKIKNEALDYILDWTTETEPIEKTTTFSFDNSLISIESEKQQLKTKKLSGVTKEFLLKSTTGQLAQATTTSFLLGSAYTQFGSKIIQGVNKIVGENTVRTAFNFGGVGLVEYELWRVGGKVKEKGAVGFFEEAIYFTGAIGGFEEGLRTGEPFRSIKLIGKKYVSPERITSKEVISYFETGKGKQFPYREGETPSQLAMRFNRAEKSIQIIVGGKKKPSGWHVTTADIKSGSLIQKGTSENVGLYISPEASIYFGRIKPPSKKYKIKDFFNFGELVKIGEPKAYELKLSKVTRLPKSIRKSYELSNEFLLSQAKRKPKGYITTAYELGKTESEAVIPPLFQIKHKGVKAYTKISGAKIPLIEAEVVKTKPSKTISVKSKFYKPEYYEYKESYAGGWFYSLFSGLKSSSLPEKPTMSVLTSIKETIKPSVKIYEKTGKTYKLYKPSRQEYKTIMPSKIEYTSELLFLPTQITRTDKINFPTQITRASKTLLKTKQPKQSKTFDFDLFFKPAKKSEIKFDIKLKSKYKPSLLGELFKIKGKPKKLTGLEVRGL